MRDVTQTRGRVYVISAVCPPSGKANSTDIMTDTLIRGMKACGARITLLAVCKPKDDAEAITKYYGEIVEKVILVRSMFDDEHPGRVAYLHQCAWKAAHIGRYCEQIKKLELPLTGEDLVIANKVYSDEVMYGAAMKKLVPAIRYDQYWSDPMTLSGILPEALRKTPRRWPFWLIEKHYLSLADQIVYGTRVLMDFQKKLYPSMMQKMRYIDVSYMGGSGHTGTAGEPVAGSMIYSGDYYSGIRNILPLYEAVSRMPQYSLDIYGSSDVQLSPKPNIQVHPRVTPQELQKVEASREIHVCILNHSCIQIPGKIFYHMDVPGKILVISDGIHREEIIAYLNKYGRFLVCDNTCESIMQALNRMGEYQYDPEAVRREFSPEKIARDLLSGGLEH